MNILLKTTRTSIILLVIVRIGSVVVADIYSFFFKVTHTQALNETKYLQIIWFKGKHRPIGSSSGNWKGRQLVDNLQNDCFIA